MFALFALSASSMTRLLYQCHGASSVTCLLSMPCPLCLYLLCLCQVIRRFVCIYYACAYIAHSDCICLCLCLVHSICIVCGLFAILVPRLRLLLLVCCLYLVRFIYICCAYAKLSAALSASTIFVSTSFVLSAFTSISVSASASVVYYKS